jgi:hypothetical protein
LQLFSQSAALIELPMPNAIVPLKVKFGVLNPLELTNGKTSLSSTLTSTQLNIREWEGLNITFDDLKARNLSSGLELYTKACTTLGSKEQHHQTAWENMQTDGHIDVRIPSRNLVYINTLRPPM